MSFYSIVEYVANGTDTNFSVPFPYIDQADVKVYVAGALKALTTDYTFLSTYVVKFNADKIPAAASIVRIQRVTDRQNKLVDFTEGSVLSASSLDLTNDQTLFVSQEVTDEYNEGFGTLAPIDNPVFTTGITTPVLTLGATDVTSTATEINQLASSGVTNADLVKLHAVTASAAELNQLDTNTFTGSASFTGNFEADVAGDDATRIFVQPGAALLGSGAASVSAASAGGGTLYLDYGGGLVINNTAMTASVTELNVLDGIPAGLTSTEIGYLDGVTSAVQTQLDGKASISNSTWTPAITFSISPGLGFAAADRAGEYHRIGDIIFFTAYAVITALGTASGEIKISLPSIRVDSAVYVCSSQVPLATGASTHCLITSEMKFYRESSRVVEVSDMTTGTLRVSGFYHA